MFFYVVHGPATFLHFQLCDGSENQEIDKPFLADTLWFAYTLVKSKRTLNKLFIEKEVDVLWSTLYESNLFWL